jgi:hypothetical protein
MEEIGFRADVFNLDGIAGAQREYIEWLLRACSKDKATAEAILTPQAAELLSSRLRTPLQVQQYLTLALEAGFQAGESPLSTELIESVLSRQIDDLEPTLTRNGYQVKDLAEMLNAKPAEVKALFNNTLDASRSIELRTLLMAAGLPA